ncbi:Crp/Fnr family transcriptional regulator [Facklamia hominis]|uniref:Crp/Fnr family transcriptional regulator n=1 Tax=Facklamia hominis TaxID=178214 RepID=A0AAJ1Q7M1_9LACT|nr:Crp/Fnr family transcriptional regulator [Facklamia hominis]EPH09982.1 hypothetical protein HMPREF9260_01196 [Facklamia hominis ACS-120-V-Sch10]MDK7188097.1 Crp/Fnr family transcriptional regulator [Facklamia hominis]RYC97473.1 Crp/Fnr family transcriptional regulator [Facklamia hominis]WPJ90470.1 Crp/Fnr family transcriptional regulator [Facklamia hominis]
MTNYLYVGSPWLNSRFTDQSMAYLTKGYQPFSYNEGKVIVFEKERIEQIYLIQEGDVKVVLHDINGTQKTVMIASKGNTLSESSAILKKESYISAITLSPSSIYRIPWSDFKERVEKNPKIMWELIGQISNKSHIFLSQVDMLTFDTPLERVKKSLYWMFNNWGEESDQGIIYINKDNSPRLTHQDLADITGLSRVSVSNAFRTLYQQGILKKTNNTHSIKRLEDLL